MQWSSDLQANPLQSQGNDFEKLPDVGNSVHILDYAKPSVVGAFVNKEL